MDDELRFFSYCVKNRRIRRGRFTRYSCCLSITPGGESKMSTRNNIPTIGAIINTNTINDCIIGSCSPS